VRVRQFNGSQALGGAYLMVKEFTRIPKEFSLVNRSEVVLYADQQFYEYARARPGIHAPELD
jgi:hypothetical protein